MTAARSRRKNAKKKGKRIHGRKSKSKRSRSARARSGGLKREVRRHNPKTQARRKQRARAKAKQVKPAQPRNLNDLLDDVLGAYVRESWRGLTKKQRADRRRSYLTRKAERQALTQGMSDQDASERAAS